MTTLAERKFENMRKEIFPDDEDKDLIDGVKVWYMSGWNDALVQIGESTEALFQDPEIESDYEQ